MTRGPIKHLSFTRWCSMVEEDGPEYLDAEGIGNPIFVDSLHDKKFFASYRTCNLTVEVGDCARIRMEANDDEDEYFCYGQILAIYEDSTEEMFIEVRWFLMDDELSPQQKNLLNSNTDELVETDTLDDTSAGAACEVIVVEDWKKRKTRVTTATNGFPCRYMVTTGSNSVQEVSMSTLRKRGATMSHYNYAYADYHAASGGGSTSSDTDHYSIAIKNLHISVIPENLPCRTKEFNEIERLVKDGLESSGIKSIKPVYISGMPGTGKTATVKATINALRKEAESGQLKDFNFIEINCLKLKAPSDAYSSLWRQMTGYNVSSPVALKKLHEYFKEQHRSDPNKRKVTVCLLDELDFLVTKDFAVLYNFFTWPTLPNAALIFIGIANKTNLPGNIPYTSYTQTHDTYRHDTHKHRTRGDELPSKESFGYQ